MDKKIYIPQTICAIIIILKKNIANIEIDLN